MTNKSFKKIDESFLRWIIHTKWRNVCFIDVIHKKWKKNELFLVSDVYWARKVFGYVFLFSILHYMGFLINCYKFYFHITENERDVLLIAMSLALVICLIDLQ